MATTFKDMQDAVVDSLHPAIKNQSNYSLTLVKSQLNNAYYNFVKRTKCIEGTVSITTVANQDSYTASDKAEIGNIIQPYEVRYIESGSSNNGYLLSPYPGGHSNLPRTKTYGIPSNYWIIGGNAKGKFEIGTWPIIDASGGTLKIWAFMWPSAEMNVDSDEPEIEEAYREALIDYALYKIYKRFKYLKDEWHNLSISYKNDYLSRIVEWQSENYTDDMGELPEVVDIFGDW